MAKDKDTMQTSNFNLQEVSTQEYEDTLDFAFKSKANVAVFGRRGSGKTQISKDRIREKGYEEVYINLSVFERPDMGGYPNVFSPDEFVSFKLPSFYEKMISGDKDVVALLDEVDKAEPALWAPLLEFTQFRTINKKPLPRLRSVIMTGNLISEGGSRPCMPLLDRTTKFLINPNARDWLEWSGKSGRIHPSVTAFIEHNQGDLFGAVDPDSSYADPSPRSWEIASSLIKDGEADGRSSAQIMRMVNGCVGRAVGVKYSMYLEHYLKLVPFIRKIFDGTLDSGGIKKEYEALQRTEQLVAAMQVCSKVSMMIDEAFGKTEKFTATKRKIPENLDKALKNSANFLNIVDVETFMVGFRSQLTITKLLAFGLDDHEEFDTKVLKRARDKMKNIGK